MNVAIFTDNDFDKVNGVTTTLSAVLRCAPREMRLRIYTAASLAVEQPDYLALRSFGVPIPFYGAMRMYVPRLLAFVARARADRIDVVHLTTPGPVGLAALYVAWRLDLPLVGSFHTDLAAYTTLLSGSPRLGALMREYMRWPYGKCARVLVPSHHTRTLLLGANGNADKTHVWSRGVDTDLFTPQKRSPALRDAWHVSDNRPALLYVGRVSREKGLALLRPLRDRLHASGIEHRFVIVGQGPMSSELRSQLPDAVFTGVLSRAAVAEVFASADAFVFPSRTDTAGNVVLEAQASGLPVIVSSDGGPRENIIEGTTGLVCQTDDASEWAAAVARALGPSAWASAGLGAEASAKAAMRASARAYALTRRWEQELQPLYRAYVECAQAASDTPSHRVTEKALSA
jgi:glycosyltransferase involved in cell wall biosynthesis